VNAGTELMNSAPKGGSMDDLTELANARMPFGKYKDRLLIDLPDTYLVWFSRQGFP
jgi:uncharacterized protein (DUF3820 family)